MDYWVVISTFSNQPLFITDTWMKASNFIQLYRKYITFDLKIKTVKIN